MTWDDVVALARASARGRGGDGVRHARPARARAFPRAACARTARRWRSAVTWTSARSSSTKHDELFVTPHYEDYPMVLVSLPTADPELVRELVEDAWAERAPKRVVGRLARRRREGTS